MYVPRAMFFLLKRLFFQLEHRIPSSLLRYLIFLPIAHIYLASIYISPFLKALGSSRMTFPCCKKLADTLLPVCGSVGSSGGLEGVQRACFSKKARFWVLLIGITLTWPAACVTHTPNHAVTGKNHINRALFRLAAELWPS